MTADTDPRAFALARLAEEEADALAAQAVNPGRWYTSAGWDGWHDIACDNGALAIDSDDRGAVEGAAAQHIVRQDPTATLARVAALRRLVGRHVETMWGPEGPMCDVCKVATGIGDDHEGEWPCLTLRDITNFWPDHDDFDLRWKL